MKQKGLDRVRREQGNTPPLNLILHDPQLLDDKHESVKRSDCGPLFR